MSKKLFMGFALALALVGCSQEEELVNMSGEPLKDLTGEIVEAGSRTYLGSDGSVLWSEGDAISLFKKNGYHQKYTVREYNTSSTNFDYAKWSEKLSYTNESHYAVYPFSEGHSISGSTLTLDLSSLATQSYTSNTFENGKAVMVAKSATTQLAFTNAFSLANVQLTGEQGISPDEKIIVTEIEVTSATKTLAGTATVNMNQDKPAAVFDDNNGLKTITLNCGTGVELTTAPTNFYILMPAVTFPAGDLTVTIKATVAGEEKEYVSNLNKADAPFYRSKVTTLPKTIYFEDWTGSTEATIKNVENVTDANEALKNNTGVDIADATGTKAITIPAKTEDEAAKEHTIDLSDATMPTDGTPVQITVVEGDASNNHTVETLKVVVPEGTTPSDFTINAPGTTVTLTTANGTVIETITAATANETLIISSGITVNKLIVKKGNVRIEEGAIIKRITRSEDNPDKVTYVYCEGSVPEDVVTDKNVILLSADFIKISDTIYEVGSVAGLRIFGDAVNAGNSFKGITIKLAKDLDLNNEEWTPIGTKENPFMGVFDGNNFTIKNLTVTGYNSFVGFFGNTLEGEIKNLKVENAKVSGRLNVGVVSGQPYTSKYTNITVKGHVEVNGMAYVGGVGGKNAYANWENITVDVDASSYVNANSIEDGNAYRTYVGGVVGFNGEGSHSFKNITSNINVKGSTCDVGGLFGIAHYGNQFENCHCTGNVEIYAASEEGEAQEIGGIAGVWNNGGEDVIFTNCKFEGELKANDNYVINTNKFGNLVCSAYNEDGAGKLIIDGVEYRQIAGGVVVFKDGVYEVDNAAELKNVVGFVEDGQTIKLTDNVTFDENSRTFNSGTDYKYYDGLYYIGDKSFTIDLNGKTINQDGAVNDYLLNFKNDGAKANTITLKNGTINAGTAAYCALATSSSSAQKITINTENITFVNNNSNGATLKIRGGTELNVKTGTIIEGMNSYVGIEAVGNNTVVNIYDGAKIYQKGASSYVGAIVGASYNATMNIYGGYGESAKCGIIVMSTGATINVSGGEWIANNGGTVANGNQGVLVSQNNRNESGWACKSVMNVTGGTFKGGYDCWGMGPGVEADDAQINIKGGNFNADPTKYVVAGYEVTGNYTVGKSKALTDLEAAIAKGGNVTLTNDVTLLESLKIENTVVLDLNGKTINAPLFSAFEVKAGGELTIKNGKVVAYESTVRAIGGKATIESGEYTSTGTAVGSTPATYRYSLDCREGGELIINGGTFKSNNGMINVGSTVTINGGKFENIVEKTMTRHFAYVYAALTINDGEFLGKANGAAGGCFFCGAAAGCDIQVNGGKFTSLWTSGSVNGIFELYSAGGTINVTGGMFNTNKGIANFVVANTDEATKDAYPYVAK